MIKRLFFTAALLLAHAACAANPSADLPIQIVPAGSAPAVPAPAAAAGFTTLAFNHDFTSAAYSDPHTWLDLCGASNPVLFAGGISQSWAVSCNEGYQMVQDGGSQVLKHIWLPSFWRSNLPSQSASVLETANEWSVLCQCAGLDKGQLYPFFGYYEIEWRSSFTGGPGTGNNFWAHPPVGGQCGNAEFDWIEVLRDNNDSDSQVIAFDTDANGCGKQFNAVWYPPTDPNLNWTQYHKLGVLVTGDTTHMYWSCTYLDGVKYGCYNVPPNWISAGVAATRGRINIMQGVGNYANIAGGEEDVYIRSMRGWTCANWQNSDCNTGTNVVSGQAWSP
jgi:hypothetical protein